MNPEIASIIASCEWFPSKLLIFSENVFDPLIYYSHLLPLVTAIVLGLFVLLRSKGNLSAKILAGTLGILSIWLFCDMVVWATGNPSHTLFFWSVENMVEPMVYAGVLSFLYLFIKNKELNFWSKGVIFVLLLPTIVFASTKFNILGYDLSSCDRDAIEGPATYYGYAVEIIFIIWALVISSISFFKTKLSDERKKIALITFGAVGFLLAFSFGNVVGSIFSDSGIGGDYSWSIGQYGIFGVPVFAGFLAYIIVKYHSLNIKTFGAQVLIAAILIIIGSEFFFVRSGLNRILVGTTFVLTLFGGYLLVKSVAGEIKAKEELQVANEGQATLIHFINHQIKGYLNKAKIVFSEVLTEPEYAPNEPTKKMLSEGEQFMTEGVDFVQQILKASDIEKGTFAYEMKPVDLKEIVSAAASEQRPTAESKGLKYDVAVAEGEYRLNGDATQLREAVKNFITNSILYTPSGSVSVSLEKKDGKALFKVKDTGVGLSDEVKPKLFTKGGRSVDSVKINVNSTGYGLAIVKGIAEAHKGRVWAESDGVGKGSTFFMELPISR